MADPVDFSGFSPGTQAALDQQVPDGEEGRAPAAVVPTPIADNGDKHPPTLSQKQENDPGSLSGFSQDTQNALNEEKYGGLGQQALSGVEGLAKGITGPLAPALERAVGVNPEDIRGREEANPVTHYGSELAGLVGSSMAGVGLGGALSKIGEAAGAGAEALNIGKLGSSVVRHAVENIAFQAGEEASKAILSDPNQSVDTAITDMGLASLIGGAFGTISPLWKAASGTKLATQLSSIANKLGGIEGVVPDTITEAMTKANVDPPAAIKAAMSNDPLLQQAASSLLQSDATKSGLEFQKMSHDFNKQVGDSIANAFGKTPEQVDSIGDLSKYESGKAIGQKLAQEYKAQIDPIAQVFDNLKTKFKDIELLPTTTNSIADQISKRAIEEGWTASPSSDIMKEVNRTLKELPLQKNLKNLGDFITQAGNNANSDLMNGPLRRAGGIMTRIMKDAEADVISHQLGEKEGPLAVEAFKAARGRYAEQSALKDALDSRLHIGGSTSGFGKELNKMAIADGESLLKRLSGYGDADVINFLQKNYPQTAELIKNYHVNDLLKTASDKAKFGTTINSSTLLSKLNKMSPEIRNFIASPGTLNRVEAAKFLKDSFENSALKNYNFSNTARTLDKAMQYIPATAVGMITMLAGHNPATALLLGALTKTLGRDVPDATRLAMLKFLGSSQRVSSDGFKHTIDLINHTLKGESLIGKAIKNTFKAGSEVIPASLMPTEKDRNKLEKSLDDVHKDPDKLLKMSGSTSHYMPDHAVALGQTAASALKVIKALRPNTDPSAPLDTKRDMNPVERSRYNRVLDIAQQPLMVLDHIMKGTLTPDDVNLQKAIYPALYNKLSQKLMDQATKSISKGEVIPYKTKMGLSLYLGQAIDSTLTPQGIQAAQPKPQQNQPQTAMQPASNPKHSTSSLSKIPGMYRTPGQAAEKDRSGRPER